MINLLLHNSRMNKRQKIEANFASKTVLAEKYHHKRDASIHFDELPHIYSVDWDNTQEYSSDGIISVTTFVHANFSTFDADKVIAKMQASKNWGKSSYFGKTPDEIKLQWVDLGNTASALGTKMHEEIELYYNGFPPSEPLSIEYVQFTKYAEKMDSHWLPFRTEWMLRTDKTHKLTGTIDMLYMPRDLAKRSTIDEDGRRTLHLRMSDWKRSKKINKFSPWSNGTGVCEDLPDTNYFHYTLQLNSYKYIVEKYYKDIVVDDVLYNNIVIDDMFLVCMHPITRACYAEIHVGDHQDRIRLMFEMRKTVVAEKETKLTN
jgi:hypothetical protein